MDAGEFVVGYKTLDPTATEAQIYADGTAADTDKSETLSEAEFLAALKKGGAVCPKAEVEKFLAAKKVAAGGVAPVIAVTPTPAATAAAKTKSKAAATTYAAKPASSSGTASGTAAAKTTATGATTVAASVAMIASLAT